MGGFHINFASLDTNKRSMDLGDALDRFEIYRETYIVLEFIFRLCMGHNHGQNHGFAGYEYNANYNLALVARRLSGKPPQNQFEILLEEAKQSHRSPIVFGVEHLEITKQTLISDLITPYHEIKQSLERRRDHRNRDGHTLISHQDYHQALKSHQQIVISGVEFNHRGCASFFKFNNAGEPIINWNKLPYFRDYIGFQYAVYRSYLGHEYGSGRQTGIYEWIAFKIAFDHSRTGEFDSSFFTTNFSDEKIRHRLQLGSKVLLEKLQLPYSVGLLTNELTSYLATRDDRPDCA